MAKRVRYFAFKTGRKNVTGGVIKVDTSAGLEERLEDFAVDENPYEFRYLRKIKSGEIYEMVNRDVEIVCGGGRDAMGGNIGVPVPIEKGKPDVFHLKVTDNGELSIYKNLTRKRAYLSEITRKKAKDMRESARCWSLQRAYIYE